ncbi:competence protein ComJ [Gloeobacter morelensis]|uniref:Competence protein J (ComJ) n=1 Tax=Gloeobacter morelensis MG652769 TaxID=2781736 RepID=A0ABY3PQA9_9CYAN|nr:competence protein ComJ [Gloeobacter morelensis]UFP95893.1 hypothetical protein ISF26_06640 [Gloeobacter morelensis MG652769]
MLLGRFTVFPGEERTLAVQIQSEEFRFNEWNDKHIEQGFSWRPGSVSFETLSDIGLLAVEVRVEPTFEIAPSAMRAIQVPFAVPEGESIFVGALIDEEDHRFAVPPGEYALVYQTGLVEAQPPPGPPELDDADTWCRLSFVRQDNTQAEILRIEAGYMPVLPLLMQARAVGVE